MMTYASSSIPFPSISIHRTPSLKLLPREHRKKKQVLFENHFLTINLGKQKDSGKRFSLFLSPRNFNENPRETIEPTDWKTYSLWISFARFSFLFKKWVWNTASCYYLGSFWKFKWINADFNKIIVTCHENLFSYTWVSILLYTQLLIKKGKVTPKAQTIILLLFDIKKFSSNSRAAMLKFEFTIFSLYQMVIYLRTLTVIKSRSVSRGQLNIIIYKNIFTARSLFAASITNLATAWSLMGQWNGDRLRIRSERIRSQSLTKCKVVDEVRSLRFCMYQFIHIAILSVRIFHPNKLSNLLWLSRCIQHHPAVPKSTEFPNLCKDTATIFIVSGTNQPIRWNHGKISLSTKSAFCHTTATNNDIAKNMFHKNELSIKVDPMRLWITQGLLGWFVWRLSTLIANPTQFDSEDIKSEIAIHIIIVRDGFLISLNKMNVTIITKDPNTDSTVTVIIIAILGSLFAIVWSGLGEVYISVFIILFQLVLWFAMKQMEISAHKFSNT